MPSLQQVLLTDSFADWIESVLFSRLKDPKCNPLLIIFAMKAHKSSKYRDDAKPVDDSAKMVLNKLLAFEPRSNGNK